MKTRISRYTLLVFLCSFLICGNLNAATRVALVSNYGESGSIGKILDLALVQLSKDKDLIMLERREMHRVLSEHKLALSGVLDSASAVNAGRLLRVDILAVVEVDHKSKEVLGLVVFDAKTGVRLWDMALHGKNVQHLAASIGTSIQAAIGKLKDDKPDARTVCLFTVRNADLPREMDSFCDAVGRLVERLLLQAPQLTVLERSRLDQVNKERSLPTDGLNQALLGSLVMVELDIGRADGGEGLFATALLTGANREQIAKVQALTPTVQVDALAEAISHKLLEALNMPTDAVKLDLKAEAARFSNERWFLIHHGQTDKALQAAEAAHALNPKGIWEKTQLAELLLNKANRLLDPTNVDFSTLSRQRKQSIMIEEIQRAIGMTRRAIDLKIMFVRQKADRGFYSDIKWHPRFGSRPNMTHAIGKIFNAEQIADPQVRQQAEQIKEAFATLRLEVEYPITAGRVGDKGSVFAHGYDIENITDNYFNNLLPKHDDQWARRVAGMYERWMHLVNQSGAFHDEKQSHRVDGTLRHLILFKLKRSHLSDAEQKHFLRSFDKMQHQEDPRFRAYGQWGRLIVEKTASGKPIPGEAMRRLIHFVKKQIRTLPREDHHTCDCLYRMAYMIVTRSGVGDDLQFQLNLELCDFMIEQKQFVEWMVTSPLDELAKKDKQAAVNLIDRVLAVIDDPRTVKFIVCKPTLKQRLVRQKRSLLGLPPLDEPEYIMPWKTVHILLRADPANNGSERLSWPIVVGSDIYVVKLLVDKKTDKQYAELLRMSLNNKVEGQTESYGRAEVAWGKWGRRRQHFYGETSTIRGTAVIGDTCFVGTLAQGILAFSLKGGPIRRLDMNHGFPDEHVHVMAACAGKLFAILGRKHVEGYLISYEPKSGRINIIGSSRRREARSPFDNTSPLRGLYMVADAKRNRVLFSVFIDRKDMRVFWPSGLWQLDAKTEKLGKLVDASMFGGLDGPVIGGYIYGGTGDRIIRFDLERNKIEPIVQVGGDIDRKFEFYLAHSLSFRRFGTKFHQHFFVLDGWIWSSSSSFSPLPWGRLRINDKKAEYFPSLYPGGKPQAFKATEGFMPIGDGRQLLICDGVGLWIADLKLSDTSAQIDPVGKTSLSKKVK